jgi:hypothetical protein
MTLPIRDQYRLLPLSLLLIFTLTHDELDSTDALPLTRLGTGPHVTPEGFKANGYDSRYMYALSHSAGAPASLHATIRLDGPHRSARDVLVSLTHATADQPKIELAAVADAAGAGTQIALRTYAGSIQARYLNRPSWRFEFRFPEKVNNAVVAPQGLTFADADTLLLAAHESDTITTFYRVDLTTGEYTGRAESEEFIHLNSLHMRGNGECWANAYVTSLGQNRMIRIDLATSFATGELAVDATWNITDLTPSINFVTIGGVEYVLCTEWSTGAGYVYVYLASQMSADVSSADRVARYVIGPRVQDVAVRPADGLLYASRNMRTGDSGSQGWVQSYDIASAIASLPDGATLAPVATYPHATKYTEGLEFRPGDGRLWSSTEGLLGVGDHWSHSAVWSSALAGSETNTYLVDYHSSGLIEVRVNGRLMLEWTVAPTVAPSRLAIGAPPSAVAGWANGFMSAGVVRDVAFRDGLFTPAELAALCSGTYEPNTLTETELTLTNPGGELGTTGWTDELAGALGTRVAGPAPYEGAAYFASGGSVNGRARQRLAFSAPAGAWVRVEWQQASWDGASDPGGVGLRALDAGQVQLAQALSSEATVTPSVTWVARSHSMPLPAGTEFIDVLQHRTRTVGANVDCYVDAIRVFVYTP